MPNGGFGCGYCIYLNGRYCNLRKVKIRNDHWVVCAQVAYYENGLPARLNQFLIRRSKPEPKGPIFTITGVEGAYRQIPWLGKHQVFGRFKPTSPYEFEVFNCDYCSREVVEPRNISVKRDGEKSRYYFCSWNHYLTWRNLMFDKWNVNDDKYSIESISNFKDFTDLEIIANNSTSQRRQRSNELFDLRKKWKKVFIFVGFLAIITFLAIYF